MEISDRKYSGTLEGLDEYRRNKPKRGRKPKNPKPFNINTAEGESQAGCISGKESLLISPIIHWEEKDVWDFLKAMEVPHCSLYDEGWKRLGCINCPMASPKQKAIENKRWPHVKRNWIKAIIAIRQGGVLQGERTTHKTNLGLWNISIPSGGGKFGSRYTHQQWCNLDWGQIHREFKELRPHINSGGARPEFRIPQQWMGNKGNWQGKSGDLQERRGEGKQSTSSKDDYP